MLSPIRKVLLYLKAAITTKLKETSNKPKNHEKIGPTAAMIALYRAYSDLPFAKAIARAVDAEAITEGLVVKHSRFLAKAIVGFESRYRSIDSVLKQHGEIKRFMEIPAGFSPRGISYTNDSSISYVECDLPKVIKEKKRVVADILKGTRGNLHFRAASILNYNELQAAATAMGDGRIAIITEGLLVYLSEKEKRVAAENILKLLRIRGGIWVTTDFTRLFPKLDFNAYLLRRRVAARTGFNPKAGYFESNAAAQTFFENMGFKVTAYSRVEVKNEMSPLAIAQLSSRQVKNLLEPQLTFALEPA